jgi:beta-lactamase regulating signal transducer with metallopeptidase domain
VIAALMFYGIVVSTLVATGAVAAEWLARRAGIAARLVWTVAMMIMVALIGLAPYRGSGSLAPALNLAGVQRVQITSTSAGGFSWTAIPQRIAELERSTLLEPTRRSIAFVQSRLPESAGNYLIALWLIAAASLVVLMVAVHLRLKGERRRWPLARISGVEVRVAPDVGPAVIGIIRPDIVVPRWLLARSNDEQQLVIAHEAEHMRARDPMLLAFGCAVAAILPWNPAAWWMLSRLRLAVELDCDARVLSNGVAPGKYGDLLIDLAEHRSGFRVSVAALADDSSHLEQRLIAMQPDFPKYARTRAVVVSALAIASLLVACDTTVPTSADVAKMDAVSAERGARTAFLLKATDTGPVYTIDNRIVAPPEAKALSADKIASIDILGASSKRKAEVRIVTTSGAQRVSLRKDTAAALSGKPFNGLLLVDGVKTPIGTIDLNDSKKIESVKIIKPPVDSKLYGDPLAANGVISITTKVKAAR